MKKKSKKLTVKKKIFMIIPTLAIVGGFLFLSWIYLPEYFTYILVGGAILFAIWEVVYENLRKDK